LLNYDEVQHYNQAKKFCTKVLKIKTQFIKASTLDQKKLSAAGKIGLQMAAK
jgi:hypothetical protein